MGVGARGNSLGESPVGLSILEGKPAVVLGRAVCMGERWTLGHCGWVRATLGLESAFPAPGLLGGLLGTRLCVGEEVSAWGITCLW